MADNIKTPPKFDGLNFPIWKVGMTIFLQSLGNLVAKSMTKPYSRPESEETLGPNLPTRNMRLTLRLKIPFSLL